MKKHLLLAQLLFLFVTNFSQSREYKCVISRLDKSKVKLSNLDLQYEYPEMNQYSHYITRKNLYKATYGKGRKRDSRGIKEKHKLYLIDNKKDTLGAAYRDQVLIDKNTSYKIAETDFGWQYIRSDSIVVCEVDLVWNHVTWHYHIKFFEQHEKTIKLNKIILFSLTRMAMKKSACNTVSTEGSEESDSNLIEVIIDAFSEPDNWWEKLRL